MATLVSVSEDNVVADYDLASDKSIVECSDYSQKLQVPVTPQQQWKLLPWRMIRML